MKKIKELRKRFKLTAEIKIFPSTSPSDKSQKKNFSYDFRRFFFFYSFHFMFEKRILNLYK